MSGLRASDLIGRKRDRGTLTAGELGWFVRGYLDESVSDGQMAALLMAGVLNGFTDDEARALTGILVDSGDRMDLSGLPGPTVDKHSTGGVGDGTTLLVAPLVAAAGAQLVKLSGRGLGHTGGTLDKLESIPGLRTDLQPDELVAIAGEVGCVVAAQSDRLVPADRALYALRDVTGTVGSPALIASSVMSKKLAGGAETIVLDVKTGDGAFMDTLEAAVHLAELCVDIGVGAGRRCTALVTDMDQPLGRGIGNALEVREAVELLSVAPAGRLADLSLDLAASLMALAGGREIDAERKRLAGLWADGAALDRLQRMVAAQGGDPAVCERPSEVLPAAPVRRDVEAAAGGYVAALPARAVGELSGALGAGRARKGDPVDPAVGIELRAEVGDRVAAGQPLAVIHARSAEDAEQVAARLLELFTVADEPAEPRPTVLRRVGGPR
jgi:pyrimidine-nucleoside phosphorylase